MTQTLNDKLWAAIDDGINDQDIGTLRDALEQVLYLHEARGDGYCQECSGRKGTQNWQPWPCGTVLRVAGELGVEVDGG